MTSPISAALSGTFKIGGERSVSRLGFGTMQLTGPGIRARTGPNQWVPILRRSSVMLPIPGTSKLPHLEENVAAAAVELSDADFAALDSGGRTGR
jgi:aryl-alcohol dehydrogenase-like predicted oxidoreductase